VTVFTVKKLELTQQEILLLGYLAWYIPGKITHKREILPALLCLLYISCQMGMGCFALLLIESQSSTVDIANISIDCFLFHKLAIEL